MNDKQPSSLPSSAGGVWLGPALVLGIAALIIWKPFEAEPDPVEVARAAGPHLEGTLELEEGSLISVSLDPLHEDARRQAFDSHALARRLGLKEGEPWRLSLEGLGEAPKIALEGVQVLDADGTCLAPILDGVSPIDGNVQDPLLGLFRPLEPSEGTLHWEVVLWGRSPGESGRLECSWGSAGLLLGSAPEEASGSVVHPSGSAALGSD